MMRAARLIVVVMGLLAFAAAPGALAKEKKAKGDAKSWTGTVVSYSPTEITLFVNGDKTKGKSLLIDASTTVSGTIKHGVTVTVTYDGHTAKSISGPSD